MNVLGVEFDSKLTWSAHISKQISKANKALHEIRMIKKQFHTWWNFSTANIKFLLNTILQFWNLAFAEVKTQIKSIALGSISKST